MSIRIDGIDYAADQQVVDLVHFLQSRVSELETAYSSEILETDALKLRLVATADTEEQLYFALRERGLWMKQCLEAEEQVKACKDAFDNCLPVNKELKSNYSPTMIRLRWALGCPTELDRAVKSRA